MSNVDQLKLVYEPRSPESMAKLQQVLKARIDLIERLRLSATDRSATSPIVAAVPASLISKYLTERKLILEILEKTDFLIDDRAQDNTKAFWNVNKSK